MAVRSRKKSAYNTEIRQIMREFGITQKHLAERFGCSTEWVAKLMGDSLKSDVIGDFAGALSAILDEKEKAITEARRTLKAIGGTDTAA